MKLKKITSKSKKYKINKLKIDEEIANHDEEVKKLNDKVANFYENMQKHHKINLEKEKQIKMEESFKTQRQEIVQMYEQQEEVLQGMMNQYQKDKAESDTKNKHTIFYKGCNIIIRKADLTEEREDAIVNPANEDLDHAGGAARAIASAGGKVITKESKKYIKKHGSLPTGEAMTTNAGNLPCERVIHVVGPIYPKDSMRDQKQREELRCAIKSILKEMKKHDLYSVSFPAISTGIFGFPLEL